MFRTWQTPEPVSVEDVVAAAGYDLEVGKIYRPDCANGWVNRVSIRLCVDGTEIDLDMHDL